MGEKRKKTTMKIISLIFAIAAIAIPIANRISPGQSQLAATLALGALFILIANVAIALYWLIRRKRWAILPFIALAVNWWTIGGMIQMRLIPRHRTEVANTLKIATYNAGRMGKDDSGLTARRIAFYMATEEQADILCLQEFMPFSQLTYDSLANIFSTWPHRVVQQEIAGQPGTGMAIFSRFPVIDSGWIGFEYTRNSSVWADVSINGRTVRIINCHLQTTNINQSRGDISRSALLIATNEVARAEQAVIISRAVRECPHDVILAGDFNSPPTTYVYRTMLGGMNDGFREAGQGWGYTYKYFKRMFRIDYIFASPGMKVLDYYSKNVDFGSDHNPVFIELESF